jgi:hypothetical protein
MAYIGDFALESTFDTKFTTVTTTGAPTTLAGTPVISAYVGNDVVQLTAGITLSVDFDGVTGLHNVRVVATSGNGYATASNYQLVITTGTVGGTSVVGYVVAEFSIEARSSLRPTTAGRTLDVSTGGEAGVDWANVGSPTTALNLSATNIDVDQVVASVSGAAGSVTGAVGSVTGAVGSVTGLTASDVGAIKTKTDFLPSATAGAAGGVFIAGANAATSVTTALTANITGNLSGSVGSVTGAVGSVTGAVGSVTGAVGSVTGAVGSVTANVNAVLTNGAHGGAAATAQFGGAGGITSNLTGNVTGSVGSVTGAVGSVTGAAGSVTGAVGSVTAGVTVASGGIISGAHAAAELNTIADSVLDRNMATGTDSGTDSTAVRTPRQALRVARNKATIAAGVLSVKKEDDITTSFTAAVATTAGNPISEVDPT